MAYPRRTQMVPGLPIPSSITLPPYMQAMMPQVMSVPPMVPVRPFRSSSKYLSAPPKKALPEAGPPITVFIGNIAEHAPDLMIRHILASCGQVINWKRIQGFGFCEFGSPESALRGIRLLHDMLLGPKKLVVKVDANTTVKLDEYKKAQRKKQGKPDVHGGSSGEADLEDYVDDRTRQIDRQTKDKIRHIINDFDEEMQNALLEKEEEMNFKKEIIQNLPDKNRAQKSQEILTKLTRDAETSNIKEEFEEGKRDIITREIGKFREIMKKQEAEREEERLRREQMGKEKEQFKQEQNRSPSRSRSISLVRSPRSPRSHSKASTPEPPPVRHRNRRFRSHSKSRDRERERDRNDRGDRGDRERERERGETRGERQSKKELDRATMREREEEEEGKERKKMEKKAREKEIQYQERVRAWESRERRKRKDYEKDKEKKRLKDEETEREAKRLKEFLEDYDDERDDVKYYKNRELQKRISERERERESDNKDRAREKEEIEELRNKVLESEHSNPTAIYEQLLQEHEEMYKPKIIIDVNAEQMSRLKEREREKEEKRQREKEREEEIRALEEERRKKEEELAAMKAPEEDSPSDDDDRGADFGPASNHNTPSDQGDEPVKSASPAVAGKKKKLDVKDVFNSEEDEDSLSGVKRRKLVPLDYPEDKGKHGKDHKKKDHDSKKDDKKGDENSKSTEEKRKHIKSLIDKIPTDKGALFEFTIDWSAVDNQLMERRIRPWINKKIIEYIGEPEPTLVDFICSKVLAGSQPQGILDDVQMVLDEEAEVFVVKMWRLLIYEIEAKKLGLVK